MEFRVKDLLKLQSFKKATVLSGQNNLNSPISGVTIMEAPDIADWLKGGELILTSLFPIRSFNCEEQKDFVSQLVNKGVSALVIKNHRFVTEIPEPMLNEANKLGLPFIQIPKEVPYVEIMYPVMEEIFNNQVIKLQYFKEIHDRFTALSLANEGPEKIIETLEILIGNPVALFDKNFHCIVSTNPTLAMFEIVEKIPYYEQKEVMKFPHYRQMVKYPELQGQIGHQVIVPVETINHIKTYLLIGEVNKPLEELDFIAIENAATSLSLELVKQFAVAGVEKKFKNDLIEEIVNGNFQSVQSIYQKANVIGWDLDGTLTAALFKITSSGDSLSTNLKPKGKFADQTFSMVYEAVHQYFPNEMITSKSDLIIVLYKVNAEDNYSSEWKERIKKTVSEIQKLIKSQVEEVIVQVGIGNLAGSIMEIPRSYKEALEALELGKTVFGENAITLFSELGIFRLLCNYQDPSQLSIFIPSSLKKLLDYQNSNQADLVKTLRTFLECSQNVAKTSQVLFLHYKTVAYRLDRIKDITGLNFDNAEEILSVQVGLKIVDLLERENKK